MIESTASGGPVVTSSGSGALSTWQLGVKHSITKRGTQGRCREVRLNSVAGPRRVQAPSTVLSCLVARGLEAGDGKKCAAGRSWLKMYAVVRGNQSALRRTSSRAATALARPRHRPAAPAPMAAGPYRSGRAAHRSDRRRSARQAPVTAARPSAAPSAPASEIPYPTRTTGTRTQLNAAQRTASLTVSVPDGSVVFRRPPSFAPSGGRRSLEAASGGYTMDGPGTAHSLLLWVRTFNAWWSGRSLGRTGGSRTVPKPSVRGSNHCHTGAASGMLP